MSKLQAYEKTIRVIQSCQDDTTLAVADNFMQQYSRMYVKSQEEVFHLAYLMNLKRKEISHEN